MASWLISSPADFQTVAEDAASFWLLADHKHLLCPFSLFILSSCIMSFFSLTFFLPSSSLSLSVCLSLNFSFLSLLSFSFLPYLSFYLYPIYLFLFPLPTYHYRFPICRILSFFFYKFWVSLTYPPFLLLSHLRSLSLSFTLYCTVTLSTTGLPDCSWYNIRKTRKNIPNNNITKYTKCASKYSKWS
jgi:hypothetical protein